MIPKPSSYQVLAVRPSNYEIAPHEARYNFSDYDLCIPPFFVTTALFVEFSSSVSKSKAIAAVESGLSHTLQQIPIFAGKLQFDSETSRPYSSLSRDTTVSLGVRYLEDDGSFPSLKKWEEAGYPNNDLLRHSDKLFPPGTESSDLPFGVRKEAGCPMSAFQLNFINDGIILIAAFHHWQGDAASCDMFFKTWSENTKASFNDSPNLSSFKVSFDRTYCTKPAGNINEERIKMLHDTHQDCSTTSPTASTESQEAPSVPSASPQLEFETFHVSQDNLVRLKRMCAPTDVDKYVSSWDCLAALIWRAVIRARQPMHPEWNTATQITRLTSAVNVRDRFDVMPKGYIGNGWARGFTDPVSIDTLLTLPLGTAAEMSRKSILAVSPSTIPEFIELAKYAESKSLKPDTGFHFGPDLLATSWAQIKVYDYDFGFGPVTNFRGLAGLLEGMLLYPYRIGLDGKGGYDFSIQLEEGCLARLRKDEELLAFCNLTSRQAPPLPNLRPAMPARDSVSQQPSHIIKELDNKRWTRLKRLILSPRIAFTNHFGIRMHRS